MLSSYTQDKAQSYRKVKDLKRIYQLTKSSNNNKLSKQKTRLQKTYKYSVSDGSTDMNSPNTSTNNHLNKSPSITLLQYPQVFEVTVNNNLSCDNVSKYKTEMCRNIELKGNCQWGNQCFFAHNEDEIQNNGPYNHFYKTKICKYYTESGFCPYGIKCLYIHTRPYNAYNQLLTSVENKNSIGTLQNKDELASILNITQSIGERLSVFKIIEEKGKVLNFQDDHH